MGNSLEYEKRNEPISLYFKTFEAMSASNCPSETIALYIFYYTHSKWADPKSSKELDTCVLIAFNWTPLKLKKVKKTLRDLKLIEEIPFSSGFQEYSKHIFVHLFPF